MSPRTKKQYLEIRNAAMQSLSDAALRLFVKEGYVNVTIDKIAKEANVSKGLMYNYFSGKEDLLAFTIKRVFSDLFVFNENILQEKDPVKKIKLAIQNSFKLIRENPDFTKTIMPLIAQKAISAKLETKLRNMFTEIVTGLEKLFKACGVKNPEMEAYTLGALLDGIAWQYFFLFKEDYPLKKLEKELITKYSKLVENEN